MFKLKVGDNIFIRTGSTLSESKVMNIETIVWPNKFIELPEDPYYSSPEIKIVKSVNEISFNDLYQVTLENGKKVLSYYLVPLGGILTNDPIT